MNPCWKVKRQFDPPAVVAPELDERDPKGALALSGAVCLQADGLTDRINVDVPDETPIRQFARAHDAESVALARHPGGELCRSNEPVTFAFDEPARE